MSAIGSEDTGIEVALRKALWHNGLKGYRLHSDDILGKPDIAYTGPKVAIFVDGCFWHGCPECYRPPETNSKFWQAKLKYNQERDRRYTRRLRQSGWKVVRFWGHEVQERLEECVTRVKAVVAARKIDE